MKKESTDIASILSRGIYILVEETINNHTKYRSESGEYYEEKSK